MNAGAVDPVVSRTLRVIALAMGLGILLLSGMVAYFSLTSVHTATPEGLRTINLLTAMAMGVTLTSIIASEILWKTLMKGGAGALQSAFIARTACREGGALIGCVAALLAAMNGVLRLYPAYWANMAPAVLFWSYLYVHWPSVENLENELSQVL